MKKFTDSKNREWFIDVNIATVKRVKNVLALDMLSSDGIEIVSNLAADPVKLCDILYVLCSEQAKERSVSDEDFGSAMAGDVIASALDAFLEELCDFFPSQRRMVLKTALAKVTQAQEYANQAAMKKLNAIDSATLGESFLS